jgi:hypothetical protein
MFCKEKKGCLYIFVKILKALLRTLQLSIKVVIDYF